MHDDETNQMDVAGIIVTVLLCDFIFAIVLLRTAFLLAVFLLIVNTPMA
jgi:hypothetical protein